MPETISERGASAVSTKSVYSHSQCSEGDKELTLEASHEPEQTIQQQLQQHVLPAKELAVVLIGLCLSVAIGIMNFTLVGAALPTIGNYFNSLTESLWVGTAYLLTATGTQPLYGRLSDVYGRRVIMLSAWAIFVLASIGCALSNTLIMLIILRAVMGVGAGALVSTAYLIVADVVSPYNRGKYQGLITAVLALFSALGPLIGGAITDYLGWRWCFYINVPLGVLTMLILAYALRMPPVLGAVPDKLARANLPGALLMMLASVAILLPTAWGGKTYAWNSPIIISLYCVAAVITVLTVWWEGWRAQYPIAPGSLFRNLSVVAAFVCAFLTGWCLFSLMYYLPMFYQLIRSDTATWSALRLMPIIVPVTVISLVSGIVTSYLPKWSYRVLMPFGMLLATVGCGLMMLFRVQSNDPLEYGCMFLVGFGLGLVMQLVMLVTQFASAPEDAAAATIMTPVFRALGGPFGIAISGAILGNVVSHEQARLLPGLDIDLTRADTLISLTVAERELAKEALLTAFRYVFVSFVPLTGFSALLALFCKVTYDANQMRILAKQGDKMTTTDHAPDA